jgi:hypothetical protein
MPTRATRTRFDGSGFELSRGLSRGQQRGSYQSAQDLSHTDMLQHAVFKVKDNYRINIVTTK